MQGLRVAHNYRHWVSQLMRDQAEELILGLERLLQVAGAFLDAALECCSVVLQCSLLRCDLVLQSLHFDGTQKRSDKVIPIERLLNKVEGACAQGLNCQVSLAMTRDQNNRRVGQ